MRSRLWGGIGIFVFAASARGCNDLVHSCTAVGCSDQFAASVRRADGSFPTGMHRLDVTADGVSLSCTFTFPSTADSGGYVFATCSSGLSVTVSPVQACTDTNTATGVVHQCQPIPGQYVEGITLSGTPAQVHATQSVDGEAILDATAAPSYKDFEPNGKDCGPICHQASVDWTLN